MSLSAPCGLDGRSRGRGSSSCFSRACSTSAAVSRRRRERTLPVLAVLLVVSGFQFVCAKHTSYTIGVILEPQTEFNGTLSADTNVTGTQNFLGGIPAPSEIFQLAVDEINSRDDILRNITLRMVYNSTEFNLQTTREVASWSARVLNPVALLGTWFSETSETVASIASLFSVPHLAPAARADSLTDPDKYPMFIRTTVSDRSTANALVAVCKKFGWTKVAHLYGTSAAGLSLKIRMEQVSVDAGIELGGFRYEASSDSAERTSSIRETLQRLKASPYQVVILDIDSNYIVDFFTSWFTLGMVGRFPAMIGTETWTGDFADIYTHISPSLRSVGDQMLSGLLYLSSLAPNQTASQETSNFRHVAKTRYSNRSATAEGTFERVFSISALRAWDSVFAVARAIDLMVARGDDPYDGVAFRDEILNDAFDGASGRVSFNPMSAQLATSWSLLSWRTFSDGTPTDPTRFAGTINETSGDIYLKEAVTWPDDSTDVPHDGTTLEVPCADAPAAAAIETRHTAAWAQIFGVFLASLGTIAVILHAWGLARYQASPVLRAASSSLLWLVLLGGQFGMATVVLIGLDHAPDNPFGLTRDDVDMICKIQPFTLGSAFALAYGVLFASAHRIASIFAILNSKKPTAMVVITDKVLRHGVLGLWGVDLVLNTLWVTIDPPTLVTHKVSESIVYESCQSEDPNGFFYRVAGVQAATARAGAAEGHSDEERARALQLERCHRDRDLQRQRLQLDRRASEHLCGRECGLCAAATHDGDFLLFAELDRHCNWTEDLARKVAPA